MKKYCKWPEFSFLLCFLLFTLMGQAQIQDIRIVNGRITDATGVQIIGVTVKAKNATIQPAVSDKDGLYTIKVSSVDTLIFSDVRYETREIPVLGNLKIDVVLAAKEGTMDEVAVVAFGAQKKSSVVGAQSTISPQELKLPVANLTNSLAGRLSGVVGIQGSGMPGNDGSSLYIRGIATLSSSPQSPLLVVDGVPDRAISNIDPEDIASFTILKDASATAVYGTRAANGVILINTKKGRVGKPEINVELNRARTQFTDLPEFVDAATYMSLYNEARILRGRSAAYSEERIQKSASGEDPDLYPDINWYDEIFNKYGSNQRINVNVRGGAKGATYYVGAGYFGEKGMTKTDGVQNYNSSLKFNRFNFLTNVNVDLTRTTKLEIGINGFVTNFNAPGTDIQGGSGLFNLATKTPPHVIPPIYSNGQAPKVPNGGDISPYIALIGSGYRTTYTSTIRSNVRLRQDLDFIVKGLSVSGMFAYDGWGTAALNRTRTLQTYYASGRNANGELQTILVNEGNTVLGYAKSNATTRNFYSEASLNYAGKFGVNSQHDVSGMLLFNQSDYVNGDAGDLISSIPFRQRALVGRATYGYDSKYFVEGNFGYSGSENFTPQKRYGFFPSIGAGWIVSNEKFFESLNNVVSYFKLRYSYGLGGNSNTGDRFLYLTRMVSANGYTFGVPGTTQGFGGFSEGLIGSDISWETSYKHNLGVELNFFNNNLQLIAELFRENRKGILLKDMTIGYTSGFTDGNLPYNNIGQTRNQGIDLTLTYNKNFNNNSFFNLRGTFSYNDNILIRDNLPPWDYAWRNREGHKIGQRFGYIAEGLFKDSTEILSSAVQAGDIRPGDIKYKDLNGDGVIDAKDQKAIGRTAIPQIVYGLNFAFGIRNFDLVLFFQGVAMKDMYYGAGLTTQPFSNGPELGNLYTVINDRWTPENPNPKAFYPRLTTNDVATTNYATSTWWIRRGDYVRLKTAELGYNFKLAALKKYSVKNLRLFLTGTNLFTLSPWKLWDPEQGDDRGANYPNITSYNLGLRVSFN